LRAGDADGDADMTGRITRDYLALLGLSDFDTMDEAHVAWPTDRPGEAQSSLTVGLTLAVVYGSLGFAAVARDLARQSGIGIERERDDGRILRFVAPPGETLEVRVPPGASEQATAGVYHPPDEPGVVVVDLRQSPRLALMGQEGGLVVHTGETGLDLASVAPASPLEPLAPIESPVSVWLPLIEDASARDLVGERIRTPSSWAYAVSAGIIARLVEPDSGIAARQAVERLLRGEIDPLMAGPRLWAQALTDAERHTLRDLALAEVDAIDQEIRDLAEAVHADAPGWPARWISLCHRRDDLEGVRLLLAETGAVDALEAALRDVDREGELLRLSTPSSADLIDERARRVGLTAPLAWWGSYPIDDWPS
jgi:hypothetical protein